MHVQEGTTDRLRLGKQTNTHIHILSLLIIRLEDPMLPAYLFIRWHLFWSKSLLGHSIGYQLNAHTSEDLRTVTKFLWDIQDNAINWLFTLMLKGIEHLLMNSSIPSTHRSFLQLFSLLLLLRILPININSSKLSKNLTWNTWGNGWRTMSPWLRVCHRLWTFYLGMYPHITGLLLSFSGYGEASSEFTVTLPREMLQLLIEKHPQTLGRSALPYQF